jgi:hypothetical protein
MSKTSCWSGVSERDGGAQANGATTTSSFVVTPSGVQLLPQVRRLKAKLRTILKKSIIMQIKLFTIPVGDSGTAQEEMNRFLRGHKILEVQNQLISNENGAYWCFCVRYIEKAFVPAEESKGKVDYKQVLNEATFKKFSKLREIRKKVAADEGLPAFAVFTDEKQDEKTGTSD